MQTNGIHILEPIFEPYFGCAFLLNESEEGWPFNIFIFDCNIGDNWYGYLPDQSSKQKFLSGHVNLKSLFFLKKFKIIDGFSVMLC
jgi:hypothetical protein